MHPRLFFNSYLPPYENPELYAQDLAKFQAQTRYKTLYQYVFNDEMGKLA